ncbi:8327_t:CDS:2 [Paraglomus occultum]|uniref:8327_t:CDS:1 n=1 Tax=Paraglomus occultum TaxID=144539 RepID=A0A9N9FUN0_9GLOM|nr:8327_t:CDS:2 [Paraglomus occultum]
MTEKVIEVKHVSKRYGDKTVLNNVSFSVRKGTIHGFIGPNGAGKTTTLSILTRLVLPTHGEAYIDNKSVNRDPSFNQRLGFIPAEPKFPSLSVENYLLDCGYLRDIPKEDLFNNLKTIRDKGGTILMSTHILSDLQKLADDITMIKRGRIVYSGAKTPDIEKTYEDYFIEKVLGKMFSEQAGSEEERAELEEENKFSNVAGEFFGNEFKLRRGEKEKKKYIELAHVKARGFLMKEAKNKEKGKSEEGNKRRDRETASSMEKMYTHMFDSANFFGLSFPFTADNVFFFQQTDGTGYGFPKQNYTEGKAFWKLLFDIAW